MEFGSLYQSYRFLPMDSLICDVHNRYILTDTGLWQTMDCVGRKVKLSLYDGTTVDGFVHSYSKQNGQLTMEKGMHIVWRFHAVAFCVNIRTGSMFGCVIVNNNILKKLFCVNFRTLSNVKTFLS